MGFWEHSLSALGQFHAAPTVRGPRRLPLRGSGGAEVHCEAKTWSYQDRGQVGVPKHTSANNFNRSQPLNQTRTRRKSSCNSFPCQQLFPLFPCLPTANTVLPRNQRPVTLGEAGGPSNESRGLGDPFTNVRFRVLFFSSKHRHRPQTHLCTCKLYHRKITMTTLKYLCVIKTVLHPQLLIELNLINHYIPVTLLHVYLRNTIYIKPHLQNNIMSFFHLW